MTEREQIARIIEPEFFERGFEALVGAKMAHYQADALAKADQIIALRAPDALSLTPGWFGPETPMGELRQWCEERVFDCGTKSEDRALATSLQTGWAMCANTFAGVIEKIDSMNPVNAAPSVGVG